MMAPFSKSRNEVAGFSLIQVSNLNRCASLKACHPIANSRTLSILGKRDGSNVPAPVLLVGRATKMGVCWAMGSTRQAGMGGGAGLGASGVGLGAGGAMLVGTARFESWDERREESCHWNLN